MEKKTINRYVNLLSLGIGLIFFGVGVSAYKLRTDLFEKYSLDSIATIIGGLLIIYSLLHFGPKVSEIIKKLK